MFTSKKKKVLLLLGQEDKDTFCGELADTYEATAIKNGHEIKRVNLGELKFDPLLHKGYKVIQNLEVDLVNLQSSFKWCEHLVLIYPNWWGTMPALLKGLFDRFYLPGFAFRFFKNGMGWEGLLKGKSARVIITMDSRPIFSRMIFGDNANEIRDAILGFSGFYPVNVTKFGPIKNCTEYKKNCIKEKVENMAKSAI